MRCYNGCPDSEYQAHLDEQKRLSIILDKTIPGATCTYFPAEERYQCFTKDYRMIGEFSTTKAGAVHTAMAASKQSA